MRFSAVETMFRVVVQAGLLLMASGPLWAQDDSSFALHTFNHDDRRIRYLDQGTGRVLFLVHGMAADHRDWKFQIPVLTRKYRVVALDLAFFGESDPGPLPHTTRNHARDCLALLDHLAIEKAVLMGHSLGSWIIREMYGMRPRLAEALVDVDGGGLADPAMEHLGLEKGIYGPGSPPYPSAFNLKRLGLHKERVALLREQFGGRNPRAQRDRSPAGRWCRVPVLVVLCSYGAFSQDEVPEGWVETNLPSTDASLVVIRESGHWVTLERPQELNRILLGFLSRLP